MDIVGDSFEDLKVAAEKAIQNSDMLVISAGRFCKHKRHDRGCDSLPGRARRAGARECPSSPASPPSWRRWMANPAIGLPGNPVSALVIFELFAVPAMYWLAGCEAPSGALHGDGVPHP